MIPWKRIDAFFMVAFILSVAYAYHILISLF